MRIFLRLLMIVHRIKEFIDYKKMAVSKFEKLIGASDGTVRNAIKKDSEINSKWLVIIAEKFTDLNLIWLLTGKGTMLNGDAGRELVVDLSNVANEAILDYMLVNADAFRTESKLDAVVALFSNFEQQRELKKMYDKIERYEKLLEEQVRDNR